jgi:hypothetical protein
MKTRHIRLEQPILVWFVVLALIGCASKNPAIPATPANVQLASFSKTLADTLQTSSRGLIALRDNGSISQAETVTVQNYILLAANTGKAMDAELVSADDWPTQKAKIIKLWSSAGLGAAQANLGAGAAMIISTIIDVVNQILIAVGGPTI